MRLFILVMHSGGYLTVTDANLIVGRLLPEYFPKIFGEKENEALDIDASRATFQHLVDEVRSFLIFPFNEYHWVTSALVCLPDMGWKLTNGKLFGHLMSEGLCVDAIDL